MSGPAEKKAGLPRLFKTGRANAVQAPADFDKNPFLPQGAPDRARATLEAADTAAGKRDFEAALVELGRARRQIAQALQGDQSAICRCAGGGGAGTSRLCCRLRHHAAQRAEREGGDDPVPQDGRPLPFSDQQMTKIERAHFKTSHAAADKTHVLIKTANQAEMLKICRGEA